MSDMPRSRSVPIESVYKFMIASSEPGFVVREIADEFGLKHETARNVLEELVSQGKIQRKNPTSRVVIYYAESR